MLIAHVNDTIIIEFAGYRELLRTWLARAESADDANFCQKNSRYPAQPCPKKSNFLDCKLQENPQNNLQK